MISSETLRLCMPDATGENIARYAPHIDAAMLEFDISTPQRMADFIAQIGHESASLRTVSENLNYSAEALRRVWPSHFNLAEAAVYARKPEATANRAYADRMGNGNEDSGDGWRYRGAGLIQLTGRDNQEACALHFSIPLQDISEWLRTPEGAARAAGWFWLTNELNALADVADFLGESQRVNGSGTKLPNGWDDRQARRKRARGVLGFRV